MQHINLDIIKNIAIQLIYTKPEPIEDSSFCKHPYISHPVIMLPDTNEPFNVYQDIEKYHLWKENFAEDIRQKKNAYSMQEKYEKQLKNAEKEATVQNSRYQELQKENARLMELVKNMGKDADAAVQQYRRETSKELETVSAENEKLKGIIKVRKDT